MVLQDKYKAKASKAWKASRGLSTAPKPTTRRPQPPELDNQTEFPDLNKSDSSDGSSSENDSSGVSQSEDKLAFSSGSNNSEFTEDTLTKGLIYQSQGVQRTQNTLGGI